MGSDGSTNDRVGRGIDRLEESFGSFPVNQTTLGVAGADYETARRRADAGLIDIYVRVRNEDGAVLHVCGDEALSVPRCVHGPDEVLSGAISECIRDETGVDCTVDDVARVTIAGVHDEADPDAHTVYRLIVLLDADHERGTPDGAVWKPDEAAFPDFV